MVIVNFRVVMSDGDGSCLLSQLTGALEGRAAATFVVIAVTAAVLFCVVATIYSLLWARWFRRGPLETLMRIMAG